MDSDEGLKRRRDGGTGSQRDRVTEGQRDCESERLKGRAREGEWKRQTAAELAAEKIERGGAGQQIQSPSLSLRLSLVLIPPWSLFFPFL